MLSRDGVAAIAFLGSALLLLWLSRGLPHNPLVPIGPSFYPRLLLSATAILAAALLVSDVAGRRRPRPAPGRYRLVILAFIVFTLYVASLAPLGFRLSTFLFVLVLQIVLEPPASARRWALVLTVALATTLVTYYVFEGYLSVLLPRGRLTGF